MPSAVRLREDYSAEELRGLAQTGGVTPTNFRLYHYVDARDLAEASRLAGEGPIIASTGFGAAFPLPLADGS